jgi:IS5 family transposase
MRLDPMRGREQQQNDFLSHAVYDSLIPPDHFVRRLRALLDWRELATELADCYRHRGRPSVPPEVMLRVVIAQYLYDYSDRQMEEALSFNIAMKFLAGLEPDAPGIDHSTISLFRGRVGNERFTRIFNRIVAAAREADLIADRMHAIDARAVKANVATWRRIDRQLAEHEDDDLPPPGLIRFDDTPRGSPDADAKWGRKNKKTSFFGYKHHLSVDADSGMVVSTGVTPGNEHDGMVMASVLDDAAGAVVADKAYDLPRNHELLERKKIENRIIRKKGDNGTRNKRRWVVERTNAIVKRWCGGGRARYLGHREGEHPDDPCLDSRQPQALAGMTAPLAPATG